MGFALRKALGLLTGWVFPLDPMNLLGSFNEARDLVCGVFPLDRNAKISKPVSVLSFQLLDLLQLGFFQFCEFPTWSHRLAASILEQPNR